MRNQDGPAVPMIAPAETTPELAAALDYLYRRIDYERLQAPTRRYPFGLTRMRRLLEALDNPHRSSRVIHIGGTKGKGSVSSMVAAMLAAGGLRTGLYTSPHLNRLEERFRVDGEPCSPSQLMQLIATVRQAAEQLEREGEEPCTFFELTTAMAFQHFRNVVCDAVVLEVGLGGRLDSTNVCSPCVTAITSIGLDHQRILGNTIAEIAGEKAGIIKRGVPVISGVRSPTAAPIIAAAAQQHDAPLWQIGRDFDARSEPLVSASDGSPAWGSRVDFSGRATGLRDRTGWRVALEGTHQGDNAAVALAIIDALEPAGVRVALEDQRKGLESVVCEGRVERFAGRPDIILDTSHNEDSIAALCRVIGFRRNGRPTAIVFGTSRDKDAGKMLSQLAPQANHLVLTRFHGNPRWQDPQSLAAAAASGPAAVAVEHDPLAAVRRATDAVGPDGLVVVCGSFFLAAETRPMLVAR